jgi:subtilisin family serine protease
VDERDYVVLDLQPVAEGGGLPDLGMERGPMSKAEADDLGRGRDRLVAEIMPLKLIEPVEEVEAQPQSGATWGVEAVGALASPQTGAGVTVAVLDTGIEASHPAFAGIEVVEEDFTATSNGDTHGHGTHCAGTIAGRDVEGTRIGVAQGVDRLLAGKVLGGTGGGTDTIAAAIQWAVSEGAAIISMSLGIDFPGFVQRLIDDGWEPEPATSRALAAYRDNLRLLEALADLVRAGFRFGQSAILVAASGNESKRRAADPYTIDVAPPAASLGFISVAALGQGAGGDLAVASFSNTGATLAGPGVNVTSAGLGGGLRAMSGTSMATPHVAGVAALWAERLLADTGTIDPGLLEDRLVGNALTLSGVSFADGGAGLVKAPA